MSKHLKLTELTSFDFDYILAAALIRVTVYLYKQGLHYSRQKREANLNPMAVHVRDNNVSLRVHGYVTRIIQLSMSIAK